ncbi:MAG: hypothetical protein B7Y37_13365 [Sphingobacteriia bacterium 28-36-52]|nr:MAG: hypothetical protein B7Y37_13365 [Sphingobacteriia bacterium 28-36-52]
MNQPTTLINLISGVIAPDAIYILGTRLKSISSQHIFSSHTHEKTEVDQQFILVLIPSLGNYTLLQWQERMEQQCNDWATTTTIVLETATFNHWLSMGHAFAQKVVQSAAPIYQKESISLCALQQTNFPIEEKLQESICKDGLNKALEFYAGAELYIIRKQYKLSMFMLHQATEQALSTLVKTGMGYYCCSHNIERLLRYASWVSYSVGELFPLKTEIDKKRFKLMQRAYIDSRYKADFTVDYRDLVIFSEKVYDLLKLLKVFREE